MAAYVIRRLWQMVPTMAGVILLVFFLFNWVGGDPAYVLAGLFSSQEQIASIRKELGLDEPIWVQLLIFVKQVLSFDFGSSWTTGEKVSQIFATRLPASLTVVGPLLIIETIIGVVIAVAVSWVRGSWIDRSVMILCTTGMSISILVFIIVGQYLLAYRLNWFPVQAGESHSLQTYWCTHPCLSCSV